MSPHFITSVQLNHFSPLFSLFPIFSPFPTVPPVAPVDLSAKDDGPTWIYLQWFNPSNGRGSPPLSSHVITVQEVGGQSMERTFGGEGAANVTGLLPGTEYIFSVVAVSESSGVRANSPPSNVASGATTFTGRKLRKNSITSKPFFSSTISGLPTAKGGRRGTGHILDLHPHWRTQHHQHSGPVQG